MARRLGQDVAPTVERVCLFFYAMDSLSDKEKELYSFLTNGKYRTYREISNALDLERVDFLIQSMKAKGVWFLEKTSPENKKKKAFKIKLWSAKNKLHNCLQCFTIAHKHKGHGLCTSCWDKKRAEKPERKEQLKNQHDRWYAKVKSTAEYKKYTNERAYWWRNNSDAYRAYLQKRYRQGRAMRKILNKQNREAWRKGITYTCECCNKKVQTPYTNEYLEDNFREFMDYKEYMKMKHQEK